MICPNCGTSFEGDSSFCPSCGTQMGNGAQQQMPNMMNANVMSGMSAPAKKKKPIWLYVVIALAVFFVIGLVAGSDGSKYGKYYLTEEYASMYPGADKDSTYIEISSRGYKYYVNGVKQAQGPVKFSGSTIKIEDETGWKTGTYKKGKISIIGLEFEKK